MVMKHLKKGSKEAKAYMAKLRASRGKSSVAGANVKSIENKVAEVNKLIKAANDAGIAVIDANSTWQSPMKYSPIKYSNGVIFLKWKELDLYKYSKTGKSEWVEHSDKVLKKHMEFDNPLNDIAKMYRKALKENNINMERVSGYEGTIRRGRTTFVDYSDSSYVPAKRKKKSVKKTAKKAAKKAAKKTTKKKTRKLSGYEKTTRKAGRTRVVYSRMSGIDTESRLHTDYNSPEVNIQIGLTQSAMDAIAYQTGVIAANNVKLMQLKAKLAFANTASDKARIKRQIVSVKNFIANTKKQIQLAKKSIK